MACSIHRACDATQRRAFCRIINLDDRGLSKCLQCSRRKTSNSKSYVTNTRNIQYGQKIGKSRSDGLSLGSTEQAKNVLVLSMRHGLTSARIETHKSTKVQLHESKGCVFQTCRLIGLPRGRCACVGHICSRPRVLFVVNGSAHASPDTSKARLANNP
jgi:hypothetical protein